MGLCWFRYFLVLTNVITLFTSLVLTELIFYSSVQLIVKNMVKFKTKFEAMDHIKVLCV